MTAPEEENPPPPALGVMEIVDADGRYRLLWETPDSCDSRVLYWEHPAGSTHVAATIGEFDLSHEVRLLELASERWYDYYAFGLNATGDTLFKSLPDSFVTGQIWPAELLRAHFIDVKQGDGCFIETAGGFRLMMDGGPGTLSDPEPPSWDGDGVPCALNFLQNANVSSIDLMIKSHDHSDHYGGLSDIIYSGIQVAERQAPFAGYGYWADFERGQTRPLDSFTSLKILNTGYPPGVSTGNKNNSSIVLKVIFGEFSILMTGDAENPVNSYLLQNYSADLPATVLKVNHHGSSDGISDSWLDSIHPLAGVISCGTGNPYGHPHPSTLEALNNHSVEVFRTDLLGDITIVSDGAQGWEWIY